MLKAIAKKKEQKRNFKAFVVAAMAGLVFTSGMVALGNVGNSTPWGNGEFHWRIGRSGNTANVTTTFTGTTTRLVTTAELRVENTGVLIGNRHTRDQVVRSHTINVAGFTSGRRVFSSHEVRGATAIGRHISMLR